MNETEQTCEHLDDLIAQAGARRRAAALGRALAGRRRDDGRGLRALAGQAAAELEQLARAEVSTVAPGQDSLL